jgi:hypothetical protein
LLAADGGEAGLDEEAEHFLAVDEVFGAAQGDEGDGAGGAGRFGGGRLWHGGV